MRHMAAIRLANIPNCHLLAARAEATALADRSVDLITVAQATNWFDPQASRREFTRILKPGGWLAILRNYGTDGEKVGNALEPFFPPQCDTGRWMRGRNVPREYYFEGGSYCKLVFPLPAIEQNWDQFLGAVLTSSYAPDPDDPAYPAFEVSARDIFKRFSQDGVLHSHANTEVWIGQMEAILKNLS
jgi:SAM-dependent methyltransferase